MLCFNSEECFKKTLENHTNNYGEQTEEDIIELRKNPGDWEYQGFSELPNEAGFDWEAYREHYEPSADEQEISAYAVAMDKLVEKLKYSGVFECLKISPDFYINRVEHNY